MMNLRELEAEFKPKMHKALYFDGEDDRVTTPVNLRGLERLSIMSVVTILRHTNKTQPIISSQPGGGAEHAGFWSSSSILALFRNGYDELMYHVGSFSIERGRTYTVFLTLDSGIFKLYSGEELKSTQTFSKFKVTSSADNICVGHGNSAILEHKFVNMQFALMKVWIDYALSDSEIKVLASNPYEFIAEDYLVLDYSPAGIDIANGKWWDLSGKGNHGTIYGATEVQLVKPEVAVV